MNFKLIKLRTIKKLTLWTDYKLLELYSDIDIQNMPNYKIMQIVLNYLRVNNYNKLSVFSKDFYIVRGWSEEDAINKVSNLQRKNGQRFIDKRKKNSENYPQMISPMKIEFWLKKGYSKKQAELEIKKQRPLNKEYWIAKGWSKEDAINKISEYQSKQSIKFQKKRRNNPGEYGDIASNQLKYWLKKGYSKKESKEKLKDRQATFSLEKCIEKYGEVEGRNRWKKRQEKWLSNYKKNNFSKISQDLFQNLYDKIKEDFNEIYFATLNENKEIDESNKNYEFRLSLNNKVILPDFFIKDINKIIEFDGAYWHGEYKRDDFNKTREIKRDKSIINSGYKIFHIKELNYYKDPEREIQKCLDFIYND